jgi:hypothetical protein
MNFKKPMLFLLIASACLVTKNTNAAAAPKIIPLRSEIKGSLSAGFDFVLFMRETAPDPGQAEGFKEPVFTRATLVDEASGRCHLQDIPAIDTSLTYVRIPRGYQLSPAAATALRKIWGRYREVSLEDHWRYDYDLQQWVAR